MIPHPDSSSGSSFQDWCNYSISANLPWKREVDLNYRLKGMNLPWYQASLSRDNVFYFSFIVIQYINGECTWSRTRDLRIKNPLLYLLSYTFVVVSPEFESGTARLSSVCSTAELWNVNWKALIDSNYRIMESKSIVLTNFTKCPLKDCKKLLILYLLLMALVVGFEPTVQ